MNTYFISDTHFYHDKEFIYKPRGFLTLQEMQDTIIQNWNDIVTSEDDIYVLGDFFLGTNYDSITKTLNELHGKIHLVYGNHDTDNKIEFYKTCSNIVESGFALRKKFHKHSFMLTHYPMITANMESDPRHCVYNLHGHTHSKYKFYEERPYLYNVCCDAHDCKPVSIEEILDDIRKKIDEIIITEVES